MEPRIGEGRGGRHLMHDGSSKEGETGQKGGRKRPGGDGGKSPGDSKSGGRNGSSRSKGGRNPGE